MTKSTENTFIELTHARRVNQAATEENMISSPSPKREDLPNNQVSSISSTKSSSMETDQRDSPLARKNQDDQLKSAKAEMGEVREENKKLKRTLSQIVKDYKCLQMNFLDIFEQEVPKKFIDKASTYQEDEEPDFVSLRLGRSSTYDGERRDKKKDNDSCGGNDQSKFDQALELGLDCRFDPSPTVKNPSPGKSNDDMEEDQEAIETWPPSKCSKSTRTEDNSDISQQNHLKKARVSVRAICNAPTMNDGCQWRKYGQKIAKGNPCPRAYYRCTVSPSCPVRKHVQRCAEDKSVLITTYEGTHNHQLPVSATAMASTTSAAASMLKSASSTSQKGLDASTNAAATTFANLHGLNYNSRVPQYPFHFPSTTISTSQSHPTITLDLTVPTTTSHLNKSSSNFLPSAPRFPPTCLDFASPFSSSSSISNLGRPTLKESFYQPAYLNRNNFQTSSQQPSAETIAAATKVLTSNPTFQSALAAAITSIVGNVGSGVKENRGGGENSGHTSLGYSTKDNGVGCATSYLNRLPSLSTQQGNVPSFPPLYRISASKSPSVSHVHKAEQIE